ncbi:hypothetical protein LQW54_005716 [Pestalotiopsis sp. IQ-011]
MPPPGGGGGRGRGRGGGRPPKHPPPENTDGLKKRHIKVAEVNPVRDWFLPLRLQSDDPLTSDYPNRIPKSADLVNFSSSSHDKVDLSVRVNLPKVAHSLVRSRQVTTMLARWTILKPEAVNLEVEVNLCSFLHMVLNMDPSLPPSSVPSLGTSSTPSSALNPVLSFPLGPVASRFRSHLANHHHSIHVTVVDTIDPTIPECRVKETFASGVPTTHWMKT